MSASVYRVEDPIENFKLRIRIRELSRLQVPHENPSERLDRSFIIGWQQKIYSPWEIEDYLKHRNSSDGSQQDVANRKRLHRLDTPKQPVSTLVEPSMLFTYVDTEGPRSKGSRKVLGTYSADDKESYFAAATRHQVPDSELDGRQSKVRNRLTRERTSKSMHVCLATDVNTKAPDQQEKAMEHLLCTLHLYSDGMLEVSPDFSALLEEPGKGLITIEQSPALGLFTSDHTTAVALKRGLRLGTHTLRSSSGSDFEYTIENLNGVAIPSEIEELEKRIQASDVARSLKLRGPRGPEGNWLQDPPKDTFTYTMTMNVEIVSAKGFDGNELFISYEVVCPDNWDLRTGNLNDGVASVDSGSEKSYSEQDEEEDVLFGRTQLATAHDTYHSPLFSSGSGGSGDISLFMPGGNFIWGTLFFLSTCISIVVGPGYAFWIVPALGIIIVLGTGTPGGASCEVVNFTDSDRMNMNWGGKYDLPGGDSAPAYSLPADDAGSLVTEPIATFGHPIGMSFDVKEQNFESGLAPSAAYPVILIEVFSTQYLGGNTLEGYGYVSLRDMVGCQDFTVATWRPVGSRHSRLMEFFVGGNPVLQHPVFAEVPNKMSSSLSRFGVLSEGSGSVRFRVHSTKTDPRKKGLLNEKLKRGQPDAPSKTLGRRSVDEIVNHFKQVEALNRSMTKSGVLTKSAMNALGKSADLSASIRSADGESLSSAARTEKVQQILNRAKNRVATLTKDDSEVAQAKSRPQESLGAKRLGLPRSTEEEKDEEGERSPLLGKPPIRKIPMRMQSAEPEESSGLRLRQRMKDETEQWDSYETPIRTRRSSPALEASPLAEDNLDNIRDKMAGFQTPDAEEEDQDASESDPLIDAPRTLSGTARMRQFQREKSLSGEVTEQLTGPELKPLRPTLGKFSNPKRGPNSNA